MPEKRIHRNPYIKQGANRAQRTHREIFKRQAEGIISEAAKKSSKELGLTPTEAKKQIELLKSDIRQELDNVVAVLDHQKIHDITTSDAFQIYKGNARPHKRKKDTTHLFSFYEELDRLALSTLTEKESTGQELMWKTTEIADELSYSFKNKSGVFSNYGSVKESYEHFKSGKHGLTVFDFETFGGKDAEGRQQVDMIFEYTFDHLDSILPGAKKERVQGFVGLTREQSEAYTKTFESFRDIGSLTEKELVTAKSLARIGDKGTRITEDPQTSGRFIVEKYGEETGENLTKEKILRGIQKQREIGKRQEQFLTPEGMKVWEKDIADAVIKTQKGDMTVAGHNIKRADIPWFNQLLSQEYTPEMKDYMKQAGVEKWHLPDERALDTLSLFQTAGQSPGFMENFYGEAGIKDVLKKEGLSPYSQEALIRKAVPGFYERSENAAHVASVDVEALTEFLIGGKSDSGERAIDHAFDYASSLEITDRDVKLKSGKKQLFLANSSLGKPKLKDGVFGFRENEFSGGKFTTDGIEIDAAGKAHDQFEEWLTKKGVSYTVDEVKEIKASDAYIKGMRKVNPQAAIEDLVSVKLSPVVDTSVAPFAGMTSKNFDPSYIVGPREAVEHTLSTNLNMYGEWNEQAKKYLAMPGAEDIVGKFNVVKTEKGIEYIPASTDDLIGDTIRDGTFISVNDAAARDIREESFSKTKNLVKLKDEVDRLSSTIDSPKERDKRRAALAQIMDASKNYAEATAKGEAHTLRSQQQGVSALQEIVGYYNKQNNAWDVHPKTVDKIINLLDHLDGQEIEVRTLVEGISKVAVSKEEQDYLLQSGLEAIKAISEKESFNEVKGYVRASDMNMFDVDLSKFSGKESGEGIFSVRLGAGGEYSLTSLARKDAPNASGEQIMSRLDVIAGEIGKEVSLESIYGDNKEQFLKDNTPETYARRIIEKLQEAREDDPTSGRIRDFSVHDVLSPSDVRFDLTEKERAEKAEEILSTILSDFEPGKTIVNISEDDKSRRRQAVDIVDSILMDKVERKDLSSYGYNNEQIKILEDLRGVRRSDYIDYMDDLLEGVHKTGTQIEIDKKAGILGLRTSKGYTDLTQVPRDRFEDGIFYTQIGRQRVATSVSIDGAEARGSTKLTSALGVAKKDKGWHLSRSIDNSYRRGRDAEQTLEAWIRNIASGVREGSSMSTLDAQDVKSQFQINESRVIDALPLIPGLEDLDLEDKKTFLKSVQKDGFSFNTMNDTDKQVWAKNRHTVLGHVAERSGDEKIIDLVSRANSRAKASAIESGRIQIDPVQQEFELFNKSASDYDNQVRFHAASEDVARARSRALGIEEDASVGATLRTRLSKKQSERAYSGVSSRAFEEFEATDINLTASKYYEELDKAYRAATSDAEKKIIEDLMLLGNLTEGAAIGNARIADAMIQEYDQQRISMSREFAYMKDYSIQEMREVDELRKVVPEFYIDQEGNIQFEYRKGRAVKKHDKLISEAVYGGGSKPVASKSDGAFRFGFFTKKQGLLASEEDVKKSVAERAEGLGRRIETEDDFLQIASDIYDGSFYVESLDTRNTYRKMMRDRRGKHMTAFGYYGLGDSGDERIVRALQELGLEDQKGHVLSYEFLEELTDEERFASSVLQDFSVLDRKTTASAYREKIQRAGFETPEEFRDSVLSERYLISDKLKGIFGADFAVTSEDVKRGNRTVPVEAAIKEMIEVDRRQLRDLPEADAREKATRQVYERVKGAFVTEDGKGLQFEDGNIYLPEMSFYDGDYIDINEIKDAYESSTGKNFTGLLEEGEKRRSTYGVMRDYTGMSSAGIPEHETSLATINAKGMKITDREVNMMETVRYQQDAIEKMRKEMGGEAFDASLGHLVDYNDDGSILLKASYKGRPMAGATTDEFRKGQFLQYGETPVAGELLPEKLRPSYAALARVSDGEVGISAVEKLHATSQTVSAIRFNEGQIGMETLIDQGFEVKKLSEINIPRGADASQILDGELGSIINSNTIIDLQDEYITPDIISKTSKGSRYLAVGELPAGRIGDEVIQKEVHRDIASIMSGRDNLIDTSKLTDAEYETEVSNIVESVDRVNSSMSDAVFSKKGMIRSMSEVRLPQSTTGKASLMNVSEALKSDAMRSTLENVMIDGASVVEHYDKGRLMDFKLLSEDAFKDMGFFNEGYLAQTGLSADEMREQLKTGIQGWSHRSPSIYGQSARPVTLALSDVVKGNMAIESAYGAIGAHTDADGDNPRTWVEAYTDSEGRRIDALEYKLMGEAAPEDLQAKFKDSRALGYYNATGPNRYYKERLEKDLDDAQALITRKALGEEPTNVESLITQQAYSGEGKLTPTIERKAREDEVLRFMDDYQSVESTAERLLKQNAGEHAVLSESKDQDRYIRQAIASMPEDEQERYGRAAEFYVRNREDLAADMSKLKRASAGEINLPLYRTNKIRNLANETLGESSEDARLFTHILEASEEAFLSPKHSDEKLIANSRVIDEFNSAFRSLTGKSHDGMQMTEWLQKNLPGRMRPDMFEGSEDEQIDRFVNMMGRVFEDTNNIQEYNAYMSSVGTRAKGTSPSRIMDMLVYPEESTEMLASTYRALDEVSDAVTSASAVKKRAFDQTSAEFLADAKSGLTSNYVPPQNAGVKKATAKGIDAVKRSIKSMDGKGGQLAMGALGIAGGIMALGFVGGNPAEKEEKVIIDENTDTYAASLADQGLSVQQGPQGYVINIKADSRKGRKQVEQAIQQAMAQSYTATNVNVSMNIRDARGNITDSNIESTIRGMFG